MDPLPRELNRARLKSDYEIKWLMQGINLKDLVHHVTIEEGRVWDVLSSIMHEYHPNLLVLGTHGRGGLEKFALGSVAEEVLRLASCPVLTVGPKCPPCRSEHRLPAFGPPEYMEGLTEWQS